MVKIQVCSDNVEYSDDQIVSNYAYQTTEVRQQCQDTFQVFPKTTQVTFRTKTKVPKIGLMLVGWGGNNGSTLTGAIFANRLGLTWNTKDGKKSSNYFGSITQASTVCLGSSPQGRDVFVPMKDLIPMVEPNDIILDGWDISSLDLGSAMERARVLDFELQRQLEPHLSKLKPRKSIYNPDFIAENQVERADNLIHGTRHHQVEQIRKDIRDFRNSSGVDKVIVLWTANTERYCEVSNGLNDSAESLLMSIKENKAEISPSTMFAVASILEGCAYLNGSPQNTFVPGCIELAEKHKVFIGGDDFKSGQTKFKSVLVDFLVQAGIKPRSIVSYNHLGNNDGKNLAAPEQFRSKELSKSNVVDDMVASNRILYEKGEKPDHCVVIKYVPFVGDSKRAMDEYASEIMMGGMNTISVHNTCEDSLLASPIILDLVILTELCQRISFKLEDGGEFQNFNSVLSVLSYLCKAPLVPKGAPLVNALFRQRSCIENLLRALIGLAPLNHISLEHKLSNPDDWSSTHTENGCGKVEMNGHSR